MSSNASGSNNNPKAHRKVKIISKSYNGKKSCLMYKMNTSPFLANLDDRYPLQKINEILDERCEIFPNAGTIYQCKISINLLPYLSFRSIYFFGL